jgi:dihydroorotate dehydrogenase (fumarate)
MRKFRHTEEALEFVMEELPWGIAAGVCKDGALARQFAQAGIKIIGYGSITKEPRPGNSGDNFYFDPETGDSLNAWGIPNKGFVEHLKELPQLRADVNAQGSELWVSISAGDHFEPGEYGDMADQLEADEAADVVEGNMSCGNMILPNGEYKPIVCYDLDAFEKGVCALRGLSNRRIAVKLTPTTERRFFVENVKICLRYDVDYIIAANTVPNSYLEKGPYYDRKPAISMGRGGLAGAGLRPIVTGMIQMIAPLLKGTKTKLIAAGGIFEGRDLYDYLRHGAHGGVFSTLMWANNFDPKQAQEVIMGKDIDLMNHKKGLLDFLVEYGLPG